MTKLYIDYSKLKAISYKVAQDNLKITKDDLIEDLAEKAENIQQELRKFKSYYFKKKLKNIC